MRRADYKEDTVSFDRLIADASRGPRLVAARRPVSWNRHFKCNRPVSAVRSGLEGKFVLAAGEVFLCPYDFSLETDAGDLDVVAVDVGGSVKRYLVTGNTGSRASIAIQERFVFCIIIVGPYWLRDRRGGQERCPASLHKAPPCEPELAGVMFALLLSILLH